jgi:hypothetical protein
MVTLNFIVENLIKGVAVLRDSGSKQFEGRMPNRQPISPQQERLVQGVARGKTITQGAIDAGYSPRGAA